MSFMSFPDTGTRRDSDPSAALTALYGEFLQTAWNPWAWADVANFWWQPWVQVDLRLETRPVLAAAPVEVVEVVRAADVVDVVPVVVPAAPAQTGAPDDLTRIEGIGPKIAGRLQAAGITTFATLAATPVAQLETLLAAAGPRFKLARPDTWPEQAALLAAGDEAGFAALAAALKGGVRA